jgi:hypothetical protein
VVSSLHIDEEETNALRGRVHDIQRISLMLLLGIPVQSTASPFDSRLRNDLTNSTDPRVSCIVNINMIKYAPPMLNNIPLVSGSRRNPKHGGLT